MIAGLLDIRPILAIGADGKVQPITKVRGRSNVPKRILTELHARIPSTANKLRFGIVHVGCVEKAEEVRVMLRREFGEREIMIAPASPVLATHLGPGAWGLAWQLED